MTNPEIQRSCPLCGSNEIAVRGDFDRDIYVVDCPTCGRYKITDEALGLITSKAISSRRYILSAMARAAAGQGHPLELLSTTVGSLLEKATLPQTPFEVLDRLMSDIHRETKSLTGYVRIGFNDYPLYFLRSKEELGEFLRRLRDLGLVEGQPEEKQFTYRLTLKGWERVQELRKSGTESARAFVAMWFSPGLETAWTEGIRPALNEAGWQAVRVDRLEHNEKIDDRIIAEIRHSGLVIADFTGQRGGVYFEAGFALGLGLPVIWTVNEAEIEKVHFDTRQYNHIVWRTPAELREKLLARVRATIQPPKPR